MANMTYFESGPSGISHPATGTKSTWDKFYRGIIPSRSTPGTSNGGYVERTPSPGPASPYMTAAERAQWEKLYGPGRAPVPTGAPPTQVASIPMPRPRPGYAPTALDIAAMNAPMPPAAMPTAVAAELSTVPPAAAPPSGGQLAALLEAAQGLGGLLSGVLPGGGAPASQPRMTPQQQAAAYNSQNKAGFSDWGVSGGGTVYSKSLHDKVTSRAGTGSPSASKTAGGRDRGTNSVRTSPLRNR